MPHSNDNDRDSRADAAMARVAAGDESAFADVYRSLQPRLSAYLTRRTGNRAMAADLVQQTFLKMYSARRRFAPGSVAPWAFAIARRLLIDVARRQRALPEPGGEASASDPEREAACRELVAHAARELERLPEAQRAAFELVKQEELSHAEAAVALGTTIGAVKLRAHRANVALRTALADMMAA